MASTSNEQVNTAEFCEEVQKHECLYNKFNKDYKNKYIKAINCSKKNQRKVWDHSRRCQEEVQEHVHCVWTLLE